MKRAAATERLEALLTRLGDDTWPISLITEVYVYGSYARGAVEVGDVDLDIEHELDRQWTSHMVSSLPNGKDPYTVFRTALRGKARSLSLEFNGRSELTDIPMTILWRRGEPTDEALRRMREIQEDSDAGRMPRGDMLPAFQGLEDALPRPLRQALIKLSEVGAIECASLRLSNEDPGAEPYCGIIAQRWKRTSPLAHAAAAALRHCFDGGAEQHQVWLDRESEDVEQCTCFVSIGFHKLAFMPQALVLPKALEWIEVLDPSVTRPMRALVIRPLNRGALTETADKYSLWQPIA